MPRAINVPWQTKIDRIFGYGFKDLDGILQSSACTGNAECKSSTAADMGVITLAQKLHNLWHLTRIFE
jgi:hypothetical protein